MSDKRWHQFTIRSLLVLTGGTAIVLGLARLVDSRILEALLIVASLFFLLAVVAAFVVGVVLLFEAAFRGPWQAAALLGALIASILMLIATGATR